MGLRIKFVVCISFLLVFLADGHALNENWSLGFLHHRSLSGEISLKGLYRRQKTLFNEVGDDQQSTYYIGGLRLHSNSYLWDPDIITLDIEGEVNPESRDEKYLAVPDRAEVRTLNKLGIKTTIFNNKPITLNSYINLHQSYFNRELLTNIKSNNRQWGGMLSSSNKYLPLSVTFRQTKWDQDETQTGRTFKMDQSNLEGRINKTFAKNDRHELIYSHNNYKYQYAELNEVINSLDRISLSNSLYFDQERKYNFSSLISYNNQVGDYEFKKFESMQRILLYFPGNFRLSGNYDYFNREDEFQTTVQNRARGILYHKLFLSLQSSLFIDYSDLNRIQGADSHESNTKAGIDFNYTKKTPVGRLNLSYRYFRHHQASRNESSVLIIRNEEHVLSDGEIVLLNRPYIDPLSIVLKDETGTIIYQPDFDYIILERNSFIEIQRVPGGLIQNSQTILVDYTATPPGSYEYDANNNSFSVSMLFFRRKFEVYYRTSSQNYTNLVETDLLTLNYYNQNVFGGRVDLGFLRGGIELDDYKSNIIPYKLIRYYLDLNGRVGKKLLLSMNGNIRDYLMIDDEVDRLYANISGRVAYNISPRMKVNLDFGYLNQTGRNIDLDAMTARAEFVSNFRQLTIRAGLEYYRRLYVNSRYALNGAYLQISRKF